MKTTLIALNKKDLIKLIKEEIELHGNECDLNHIDVSNVRNMNGLFCQLDFNGDISSWDTSSVINMAGMFLE